MAVDSKLTEEGWQLVRRRFSDGPETVSVEVSPLHHAIGRPGVGALRVFRFSSPHLALGLWQ